jgi:hypothetical protein
MLKNEILNIDGKNWLVREATTEEAARNTIAHARVTGSIGSKDVLNGVTTADVVRLNDDNTEALAYGEPGGTDHSALVALANAKREMIEAGADPVRVAACLVAFGGLETPAVVELIELGGVRSLAATIADNSIERNKLDSALEQSHFRGRVRAGALAQIEAWVTSDDPIYSDAAFLREAIAKEIAGVRATIADAKAGSAA